MGDQQPFQVEVIEKYPFILNAGKSCSVTKTFCRKGSNTKRIWQGHVPKTLNKILNLSQIQYFSDKKYVPKIFNSEDFYYRN